jgi:alkylation response protein AidB-like acyl-CoA dehydrogenase
VVDHFKVNRNDLFFVLKHQLNYGSLCSLERYKGLKEEMLDMVVTEAITLAKGVVDPLQEIGEGGRVKFDRGKVSCPPEFKKAFRQFGEEGWIGLAGDTAYGGQGFPHMMRIVVNDLMYGACQAFNMGMTAENLHDRFPEFTREQADRYAVSSQQKADSAIQAGKMKQMIIPIEVEGPTAPGL